MRSVRISKWSRRAAYPGCRVRYRQSFHGMRAVSSIENCDSGREPQVVRSAAKRSRIVGGQVMQTEHERWMEQALRLAERALDEEEVPVGAVVIKDNQVIGKGYNQIETLRDPTAHAEIIAITAAANTLGDKRLTGCTLYVTLEPCPMCAGAIVLARIPILVFGAYDPKAGACGTLMNIVEDDRLNHRVHVIPGVLDDKATALLKGFFGAIRG